MELNSMQAPASATHSNLKLEELQTTLLSRATSLSETALKVLLCNRDKLVITLDFDQRYSCDLELQLETILESCNEAYRRRIIQESHDKSECQSNKRLKLCEPLPSTKSMCQKLDDICLENNWVLPSYSMSVSDGGFEAEVRIKETQFTHTICGEEKSDAEEARESAAACLLAKYVTPEDNNSQRSRSRGPFRYPSSVKVLNPSTPGETSEKYPLTSLATADVVSLPLSFNPMLQKISIKVPRNKEELLQIDGLGKDKVSRYGDRLLETIESTIKEYYLTNKKGSME
ncbi:hypothetical protein N665_0181s0018 [Sinapis alba]|nr:hypothetical protein N665_0181s0018 [Sinapis alba]